MSGLLVNALSAVVLLMFAIHSYMVSRGTTPSDLDRMYPVLSMLGFGLLAAILASAGTGVSRLVLAGGGILTAILWYLAGLGASP